MSNGTEVSYASLTTEPEYTSFTAHIFPAAIITVVCIFLITFVISVLKGCTYIRKKQLLTQGLGSLFSRQNLLLGLKRRNLKEHVDEEDNPSIQKAEAEGFISPARNARGRQAPGLRGSSTTDLSDQRHEAFTDAFITYNTEYDNTHDVMVEVEMHPKSLQSYCDNIPGMTDDSVVSSI